MNYQNIFITGSTGYLGIHLLNDFLVNTEAKIYCLIRKKKDMLTEEYLNEMLSFYFDESYFNKYKARIQIVEGDLSSDNFGLSLEEYDLLGKSCDLIIHSGAFVKSLGKYSELEDVNVIGTEKVIKLAEDYDIPLAHISTLSVAGRYTFNKERTLFTEEDFDIGQEFNKSIYTRSKCEAEKRVFKAKEKGLKVGIFRIGLLVARMKDGLFPKNINQNFFYNRIKDVINLRCIDEDSLTCDQEFTPVDLCSLAIFKILNNTTNLEGVYHISNLKYKNIGELVEYLQNEEDINIKVLNAEEFEKYRNNLLATEDIKNIPLDLLVARARKVEVIERESYPIIISSDKTEAYMKEIGFEWPEIDKEYLHKVMNYLRKIKYIN